jgi:hypothetical protein
MFIGGHNIRLHPLKPNNHDENHPNWKGDKTGYGALHGWIKRHLSIKLCPTLKYLTNKVNVAIWNSTVLEPNVIIRSISRLTEIYRRFAKTYTHKGSESFTHATDMKARRARQKLNQKVTK